MKKRFRKAHTTITNSPIYNHESLRATNGHSPECTSGSIETCDDNSSESQFELTEADFFDVSSEPESASEFDEEDDNEC